MVAALLSLMVLALIAANVLQTVTWRYGTVFQTAAWQQALFAGESGVDIGLEAVRTDLTDPTKAWTGWTSGTDGYGDYRQYSPVTVANGSAGIGRVQIADLKVYHKLNATPNPLIQGTDQWYLIRASGTSELARVAHLPSKADLMLRRFSIIRNIKTQQPVSTPQVSRTIEVVCRPRRAFARALTAEDLIKMNNHNIVIDSFDPRDPTKSTGGLYDPNKRQENGDVGTNGSLVQAGNAHIYGDVSTNAGAVQNGANISGNIWTDFYEDLPPVEQPGGSFSANLTIIDKTMSLPNKNAIYPDRYVLSQIKLNGGDKVTFKAGYSYVVYVKGDMTLSGNSEIIIEDGAEVTFYVEGDVDIGGTGITNVSKDTTALALNSVKPPAGSNFVPQIKIHGTSSYYGTFYGPTADVTIGGGGNSQSDVYGAFVGRNISMNGNVSVHYDERLGDEGPIADYVVASWFEDVR